MPWFRRYGWEPMVVNSGQNVIKTLAALDPDQLAARKDETRDWVLETFTWNGYTRESRSTFSNLASGIQNSHSRSVRDPVNGG